MAARNKKFDLIVIGSSTGGSEVLDSMLAKLPANYETPILISQHMPDTFIDEFINRLNKQSPLTVKLAKDADEMKAGVVYVSSGKKTIIVKRRRDKLSVSYTACDTTGFCPSIDETFKSLVEIEDINALSIILSGIGKDGLAGAKALKKLGAEVWAQDEKDCIAYGMPKAVVDNGLADKVIHASCFADELMRL